jgi:rfaE bifunctional protein kinase chain/domain
MLTEALLEAILDRLPRLTVGVLGDVFLDRYLEIDAGLTEPSLETGLDAYQVVRARPSPGAAGTVINNLVALGVGRVVVIAVIGDDGEGYELRQCFRDLRVVDTIGLHSVDGRRTPTYIKPLVHEPGRPQRELNRLDIKNRSPLPQPAEDQVLRSVNTLWPQVHALIVLDQVREPDCGVVTARVRAQLAELGQANPAKLILADSRERIGLFRSVSLKPNHVECARTAGIPATPSLLEDTARELARRAGRPVFCTCGEDGILLATPGSTPKQLVRVPAFAVRGPIDIVGAGDSTSAGIASAFAAGADLEAAAAFGNLVASITIQQIGTTGTASPDQVRQRWQEAGAG